MAPWASQQGGRRWLAPGYPSLSVSALPPSWFKREATPKVREQFAVSWRVDHPRPVKRRSVTRWFRARFGSTQANAPRLPKLAQPPFPLEWLTRL